ncbi:hypothetical protein JADG_006620 [Aureobasidium aubasidani]|nr:hypothetical protein JADG_006620 [Aureobasidium pullulans]
MDKINDMLERSEAWISGDRVAAFDSFDSDTTMDNDTTENTSDSIVQDVGIIAMAANSDSITTMANSITDNDTTDDLLYNLNTPLHLKTHPLLLHLPVDQKKLEYLP